MFENITIEKIFGKGNIVDSFEREYDTDIESKIYQYIEESDNPTSALNDEEIKNSEDFREWLYDDIKYEINELKNRFQNLIHGNIIYGWREMSVYTQWLKDLKNGKVDALGMFWSQEEEYAEPQWEEQEADLVIRLKASITIDQIDWIQTFHANLYPSLGEEEKEITMKNGGKIKLLEMKLLKNSNDLQGRIVTLTPEILSKTYYSI